MNSPFSLALLTAIIFAIHGSLLGPSDDEAYYWVLSHQWNWGFAYHPPLIVWLIGASREFFGLWIPENHPFVLRMPAVGCIFGLLYVSLNWIKEFLPKGSKKLKWAWLTILSFTGLTSAFWMSVPDLPLFFGFILAMTSTWRFIYLKGTLSSRGGLGLGIIIALMSKFSAVLVPISALLSFYLLAQKQMIRKEGKSFFIIVLFSALIGFLPTLFWNIQNDWGPILYQIQGRHSGGAFQLTRFFGFWAVQSLLLGPPMMLYLFQTLRRRRNFKNSQITEYVILWSLPAFFVFGIQPFFSPYKLHWIFIAFFPFVLELAIQVAQGRAPRWIKVQWIYGVVLSVVFLLSCHFPLQSGVFSIFTKNVNPKWDVTNDLYGWAKFSDFIPKDAKVIGSRYQTASQAAFAIGDVKRASLIPIQNKERSDWFDLEVSQTRGPGWPKLLREIYYVADYRYRMGPQFKGQKCQKLPSIITKRSHTIAKEVYLWKCR